MKTLHITFPRHIAILYWMIRTSEAFETMQEFISLLWTALRRYPFSFVGLSYMFLSMAFCYWPISGHWFAGFMMMSLPVALIWGGLATIFLLVKKQRVVATIGVVWCLLATPLARRFMGVGTEKPMTALQNANSLKVLSFNSAKFADFPSDFAQWNELDADIACFQEYSPNATVEKNYSEKAVLLADDLNEEVGLGLLSKYPIVKKYGRIWNREGQPNINGYIVADIAYKGDTVRVVNVHFWSMGIRINQAFDALQEGKIASFFRELGDSFGRLKFGFDSRYQQIDEVQEYVAGSRYPVILCGDFNETPFGYAYGKMSLLYKNAFEEVGKGMGFTLNRQPYFVRIDQQFYSHQWQIQSCETVSSVGFSDHFPLVAHYTLNKPVDLNPQVLVAKVD
ncbi:endonuclease/exonuclease/phosphatase family protein [Flectobacillus roseus]